MGGTGSPPERSFEAADSSKLRTDEECLPAHQDTHTGTPFLITYDSARSARAILPSISSGRRQGFAGVRNPMGWRLRSSARKLEQFGFEDEGDGAEC